MVINDILTPTHNLVSLGMPEEQDAIQRDLDNLQL